MSNESERPASETFEAYLYLTIGAIVGAVLLILPLIFVSWWWAPLTSAIREGQRTGLWKPGVVLFAVLTALAAMFICLQAARKYERADATLRRFVYGYNAVLAGLLLAALLVLGNLGIHLWYPRYLDTTEGGFYSLSDVTQRFVSELQRPVRVYVVLPEADDSLLSVDSMLTQMHDLNPKYFTFERVSPQQNRGVLRDLNKKFPQFVGDPCLIVALGDQEEKNYSIIPQSELTNFDFDQMAGSSKREFRGEVRLMQELTYLAEEKKGVVIYVTQGHGEPDLNDRGNKGLFYLQQKLQDSKYVVKPLRIASNVTPQDAVVPSDADLVLVPGPTSSIADIKVALEKYLAPTEPGKAKGRLVALLGLTPPDRQHGNTMTETGMEELLRQYNVDVTKEVIYMFGRPQGGQLLVDSSPQQVLVSPPKEAVDSRQPIAQTFKDVMMPWLDVRRINSLSTAPTYRAEAVMATSAYVWTETDLSVSPVRTRQQMFTDASLRSTRLKRDEAIPVAVAVSDSGTPSDPRSFSKPNQGAKPFMVVIGCSSLAINEFQANRDIGDTYYDLIRGSIEWCRERYANVGVQPKSHRYYTIPAKVSEARLVWMPLVLMFSCTLGLGLIVWNIRRR
jgi:hypothetical protein